MDIKYDNEGAVIIMGDLNKKGIPKLVIALAVCIYIFLKYFGDFFIPYWIQFPGVALILHPAAAIAAAVLSLIIVILSLMKWKFFEKIRENPFAFSLFITFMIYSALMATKIFWLIDPGSLKVNVLLPTLIDIIGILIYCAVYFTVSFKRDKHEFEGIMLQEDKKKRDYEKWKEEHERITGEKIED